jgi:hypothetical protein
MDSIEKTGFLRFRSFKQTNSLLFASPNLLCSSSQHTIPLLRWGLLDISCSTRDILSTMGLLKDLSLSRPKNEAGKAWPAIGVGLFVAFGGVLFGYVI